MHYIEQKYLMKPTPKHLQHRRTKISVAYDIKDTKGNVEDELNQLSTKHIRKQDMAVGGGEL